MERYLIILAKHDNSLYTTELFHEKCVGNSCCWPFLNWKQIFEFTLCVEALGRIVQIKSSIKPINVDLINITKFYFKFTFNLQRLYDMLTGKLLLYNKHTLKKNLICSFQHKHLLFFIFMYSKVIYSILKNIKGLNTDIVIII